METKRIRLLLFLLAVIFTGLIFSQGTVDRKIVEIEKKLAQVSGKARIEILLQAAQTYASTSPEKRLQCYKEALALAKKFNDRFAEINAYDRIGWTYLSEDQFSLALENFSAEFNCAQREGNKLLIARSLSALGNYYFQFNDSVQAVEYHLKSLKMCEAIGEKRGAAFGLANIGLIYKTVDQPEKALKYYNSALKTFQELEDEWQIAQCYGGIGGIYQSLDKNKEALVYYLKAWSIFEKTGNKSREVVDVLGNIGQQYILSGNYKNALNFLFAGLKISEALGYKQCIFNSLNDIGFCYTQMKDYGRALSYLQQGRKMASEQKKKEFIVCLINNYRNTSGLYEGLGDYKKAYENLKLQMKAENEMANEKSLQQINALQALYENEKKENRILALEKEKKLSAQREQLQQMTLSRSRIIRNAFIIGFFLVMAIMVLLFKKYLYFFAFWKKEKYIGRYRLLDIIGSGGMSVVYQAHSIKEKTEKVAVKILKPEFSRDDSIIKRFKQEAVIIDKLDHPNIVRVFERGEDKNRLFMAMEYLDGQTLAEKIAKESPIALRTCVHVMRQLAGALEQIHAHRIIHRDLKPSNVVLLNRDGDADFVKLLDFGLAYTRFQSTLTQTGELLGTIGYMSPEQLLDGELTAASDIYSLGVIFYETVCGQRAFAADNEIQIIKHILDDIPAAPATIHPEIPEDMSLLIMRMLEKDPGHRPSLAVFSEQLKRISAVIS